MIQPKRCEFCLGAGGVHGAGSVYHPCKPCKGTGVEQDEKGLSMAEINQIRTNLYQEIYEKVYKEIYEKLYNEFSGKQLKEDLPLCEDGHSISIGHGVPPPSMIMSYLETHADRSKPAINPPSEPTPTKRRGRPPRIS